MAQIEIPIELQATMPAVMAVLEERVDQLLRFGVNVQCSWPEWMCLIAEELGEAAQHANDLHWDPGKANPLTKLAWMRKELAQTGALILQVIEAIDRNLDACTTHPPASTTNQGAQEGDKGSSEGT